MKIFKGYWYLPKNVDKKYFGELKINNENIITLELFLEFFNEIEKFNNISPHLLLGDVFTKEKITLIDYYKLSGTNNGSNIYRYIISYKYCYIGKHFFSKQDISFKTIKFGLSNLFGWFHMENFAFLNQELRKLTNIELFKSENFSINFKAINQRKTTSKSEIRKRKGWLEITYKNQQNIYELIKDINYIQFLFSILMLRPIYVNYIGETIENSPFFPEGELFVYQNLYFQKSSDEKDLVIHHSSYLSESINSIFEKWFLNRQKIKPIIELLFSSYYTKDLSELPKFLNIVTAVESWHRVFIKDKDLESIEKFNLILTHISDNQLKSWLKNKKIIFQSVSLPKRLAEICEHDDLGLISNRKKFIRICVNTRNMLAHNLPKHSAVGDVLEVHLINNILKVLLEKLILQFLGSNTDFITNAFRKYEVVNQVEIIKRINNFDTF